MESYGCVHSGIPSACTERLSRDGESGAKSLGGRGCGTEVGVRAGGVEKGNCGNIEIIWLLCKPSSSAYIKLNTALRIFKKPRKKSSRAVTNLKRFHWPKNYSLPK